MAGQRKEMARHLRERHDRGESLIDLLAELTLRVETLERERSSDLSDRLQSRLPRGEARMT